MATAQPTSPSIPSWKEEAQKRRTQNERTRDVERKWDHLIDTEGSDAPEWMRETALRRKAVRDKETANGVPPWMQEMRRRDSDLTKKMNQAKTLEGIDSSEKASTLPEQDEE